MPLLSPGAIPLLLCAVNPLPPPMDEDYIGMNVIVANRRTGKITHRMESGKYRVLVDCTLPFQVPFYYTLAELTIYDNQIAQIADLTPRGALKAA